MGCHFLLQGIFLTQGLDLGESSSGGLISTRARAYQVPAESQVDTEQAIVGRVGQTSPDLDYRGRGCAEDEEGGKPWSLSPGKRMHCHSNLALQNG